MVLYSFGCDGSWVIVQSAPTCFDYGTCTHASSDPHTSRPPASWPLGGGDLVVECYYTFCKPLEIR